MRLRMVGLAVAAAAALAVASGAVASAGPEAPAAAGADTNVAAGQPAVAGAGLNSSVVAAMLGQARAMGSELAQRNAGTEVNVQRSTRDWAFGSAVIKAGPDVEAPESWLFMARRTSTGWQVGLEGDAAFSALIAAAPTTVVSGGEKGTFARWAANSARISAAAAARPAGATAAVPTGLSLPYPVGVAWTIIGGPHGWSGQPRPWSSIDLNGGDRRILSAQSGRAYFMCSNGGHIRIIHDNGWTTEYYHLLNEIRPNGEQYPMGTYLGMTSTRIPCGGSAGSNHVHFSLKQGTSWVPLQDKTIGGWTYFEGSGAYGGGARRGGVTRTVGGAIQNYGPEDGSPTPTVSPTASPTTSPGGCASHPHQFSGTLSSGGSAYQPNNSYYQSTSSGTHTACLDGPAGTDFDLFLQRWNGSAWSTVASGTTSGPDESVTYNGSSGYYRYRILAYSGSGSYQLGYTRPN